MDDKDRLDRTAREDRAGARRERAARDRLAGLGDPLEPRPWQPPPVPPSAVDLIHHFLWWARGNGGPEAAGGSPTSGPQAARAALELLPAARAELDQLETALLFTARGLGLTWAEMARAIGLNSPQACQQRFDRLLTRQHRPAPGGAS